MSDVTTDTPAAAPDAPVLSVAQIQNAVRVIDYAAEQGAFKGWSVIEQVLMVRNQLNDFLRAVAPAEAPVEAPAADATDAAAQG